MSQNTPGPWTVEEYGDEEAPTLVIHKDSATRVCFLATPGSHGDPARIEADAHLIAAAPDLLAALKALRDAVKASKTMEGRAYVGLGIQVNNAISKAERAR